MDTLPGIRTWAPFKIDALGIVTLLGAEALRKTTGRLVSSPYAEYLPCFAPQIFADDSIAEALPGFTLYNITDGIKATDLSAWFTRWLSCQNVCWQETTLEITGELERPNRKVSWFLSSGFAILINVFLILFPIFLGDWYGLASSSGVVLTVLARAYVLHSYRRGLDRHVAGTIVGSPDAVKLFITMPNGKVVSVYTTRGITVQCLLTEAQPRNRGLHQTTRAAAWVGFAFHAVALGMASLCMQLILVVASLGATIMVVQRFGCNESRVGNYLHIKQTDDSKIDSRAKAYIKLDMTSEEEESMVKWDLFPMKTNERWWQRYRDLQSGSHTAESGTNRSQWYMVKEHYQQS